MHDFTVSGKKPPLAPTATATPSSQQTQQAQPQPCSAYLEPRRQFYNTQFDQLKTLAPAFRPANTLRPLVEERLADTFAANLRGQAQNPPATHTRASLGDPQQLRQSLQTAVQAFHQAGGALPGAARPARQAAAGDTERVGVQAADSASVANPAETLQSRFSHTCDLEKCILLGSGADGWVYRVEDRNGEVFAFKTSHEGRHNKLMNELDIYKEVKGEYLMDCLGPVEIAGKKGLLFPYMGEKASMLDKMRDMRAQVCHGEMSLPDYEAWTRKASEQLLRGVEEMHNAGFVHGDIKPQNMLIGPDGRVRLSDLGHSQKPPAGPATEETIRAGGQGTPGFCAPEKIATHPALYAGRTSSEMLELTDAYSVGETLYIMRCAVDDLRRYMEKAADSPQTPDTPGNLQNAVHDHGNRSRLGAMQMVFATGKLVRMQADPSPEAQTQRIAYNAKTSEIFETVCASCTPMKDVLDGLLHPDINQRWSVGRALNHLQNAGAPQVRPYVRQ